MGIRELRERFKRRPPPESVDDEYATFEFKPVETMSYQRMALKGAMTDFPCEMDIDFDNHHVAFQINDPLSVTIARDYGSLGRLKGASEISVAAEKVNLRWGLVESTDVLIFISPHNMQFTEREGGQALTLEFNFLDFALQSEQE